MVAGRLVFEESDIPGLFAGDPAVVRRFAGHYGELLRIKLRSRFRDRFLIDDISQETLLRVLRTLRTDPQSIQQPSRIGQYVHAVCRNVILEKFRIDGRNGAPPPSTEALDLPDPNIDLEADLISIENMELVGRVLEELPERDRQILIDICLQERDKNEVCGMHGVDRGYLRVLLFRARHRLKDLLGLKSKKKSSFPETTEP